MATGDILDTPEAGRTAIRGTAVRAAGFGVITLLGLAVAPLLTRYLGVVPFGRYSTVWSLVTLVTLVTEAGIGALATRELAVLDEDRRQDLMRHLVGIRLALTGAGVACAVAFSALAGYGGALVAGTLVAGVGAVGYAVQSVLALPLTAQLRLGWVTAAEVLRQVVFALVVVALVVAGGSVVTLLGATIPAGIAGSLLLLWTLRGHVTWRPSFSRLAWRQILRDALPIAVAGAVYAAYFRIVMVMMSLLAPGIETGRYALSFRVIELLVNVPFLVIGSFIPLLSRAARDDLDRLRFAFGRTFETGVLAGAGLSVLTFAGAPLAMAVLTGDAHDPAVGVLRIQSATLLCVFANVAFSGTLIARRRQRELVVTNLVALAVAVTGAAVLVPLDGARGGAIATVAGELSLVLTYAVALRRTDPTLHAPLGRLPRIAVAAGAAVAAVVLVDVPVVPDLGDVALAAVVYAAVALLLRAVPAELTHALLRR